MLVSQPGQLRSSLRIPTIQYVHMCFEDAYLWTNLQGCFFFNQGIAFCMCHVGWGI